MSRVVFVQKFIPHYRQPMFNKLRELLENEGIEFVLAYGPADPIEDSKVKMEFPNWGIKTNSTIINIFGRYLYWQKIHRIVKKNDIVIVEHAAKLLDNYWLYLLNRFGFLKMCYFGHGKNFQSDYEFRVTKWLKQLMLKKVSYWFAYTDKSIEILREQGVDQSIITSVNNTLEADPFLDPYADYDKNAFAYIGGLYNIKRLDILVDAAKIIAQRNTDFRLHIIGQGPEMPMLQKMAEPLDWLILHGSLYGEERGKILSSVAGILMPGAVGLVAIDSFSAQKPIITTEDALHGPEIAYLSNDVNSVIVPGIGSADSYAQSVLALLDDPERFAKLVDGCAKSSGRFTIDNMAKNFFDGIMRQLGKNKIRSTAT